MIYPSVGQYTEAIKLAKLSPEDYFATLTTLRPVLGADVEPVMSSGNFAVVFKMQDQNNGKIYALKCFTREQESETVKLMDNFIITAGYTNDLSATRLHYEIYLSDPKKTAPEKLKTVIRHLVKKG